MTNNIRAIEIGEVKMERPWPLVQGCRIVVSVSFLVPCVRKGAIYVRPGADGPHHTTGAEIPVFR